MSRVIISIQHGDPRKETYLRTTVGTLHKGTVLKAVEDMLTDQPAHTIGKRTPTFPRRKAAYEPDDERSIGDEVKDIADAAFAT